jgi:hypothetical protein
MKGMMKGGKKSKPMSYGTKKGGAASAAPPAPSGSKAKPVC